MGRSDLIEKILEKKTQKSKIYYKIKWKGTSKAIWESIDDLKKYTTQIDNFERVSNNIGNSKNEEIMKYFPSFNQDSNLKYDENTEENLSHSYDTINKGNIQSPLSQKNVDFDEGNIEYDVPAIILNIKINEENTLSEIYFLVEWEERSDGIKPSNSYVHKELLMANNIDLMLAFVDKKLDFK